MEYNKNNMKEHCIQSLFYNLEQTSRICRAFCEDYFAEETKELVTLDEFIILDTIFCFPDICQRDLAKLILKGASHTSKLLATLEQKGVIVRTVDTKQNRIVKKIIITKKGMEIYKYASKIAWEFAQKIENAIGKKEAQECSAFLNKIKETISKSKDISFE